MKSSRTASITLICVAVLALAACGEDTSTTAGSTSPVTTTAPSTVAPSTVAPSSATPSSEPAADTAGGTKDKKVCESADRAGKAMKDDFVGAMQSGTMPTPATLKKILTDFNGAMTAAAADAGDSKVAVAVKQMGAEAAKAAAAADPIKAADNPAFVAAGANITAACKAAGVKVNF